MRTHLSMLKLLARVHLRRATLLPMSFPSVVVIKGQVPPREREELKRAYQKKIHETRSCDHDALTRVFRSSWAFLRERAAPRRLNRRATMRGWYFSLSADENERCARDDVECFAPRRASEPARGATYPTRGSKLTERTPEQEGVGGESTWDQRRHARPRPVADAGCSYRHRCFLILSVSVEWKTFI